MVTATRTDNGEKATTTSGMITATISKADQDASQENTGYIIDDQNGTIAIEEGYEVYAAQTGGTQIVNDGKLTPRATIYIPRQESDMRTQEI